MSRYLLEYPDALEICHRYRNKNFWETPRFIDGYKVSLFAYFMCGWEDFSLPLPDRPDVDAFEMRGTTFVFNSDGSLWKRFLMLPKFFNINQVDSTQHSVIRNKKISHIAVKEDGSLIAFMMLPNSRIFSKTIGGYDNEQSIGAMEILNNNKSYRDWVIGLIDNGYTPLFEYVSWDNRIVLKYSDRQLRFIGLRNNVSGEFLPATTILDLPSFVNVAEEVHDTLDNLIERAKVEENKEGWVILFSDGQLVKIKTLWYFQMHNIRTESVFREDYIIDAYINCKLDDLISRLDKERDSDALEFIDGVVNSILSYMDSIDDRAENLLNLYKSKYNDIGSFARDNYKEPYFALSMTLIKTPDQYTSKRNEMILKKAFRLKQAKEIVEKYKKK